MDKKANAQRERKKKTQLAKQHGNNNAEKITADYIVSSIWNAVGILLSCNGKLLLYVLYVYVAMERRAEPKKKNAKKSERGMEK